MASLSHDGGMKRRLQFHDATGQRRTMRLQATAKQAETVRGHIEQIIAANMTRAAMPTETSSWLSELDDAMHAKLAAVELVAPREHSQRQLLAGFIDGYIAQRVDLKPATQTVFKQCRIQLLRFLGEDRRVDRVNTGDADAYRAHLIESGLAKATIAKHLRYCRHFYAVAMRRGLVKANPFGHMKDQVKGNAARRVFVPAELVQRVLDVPPDPQWKLLIALGRWGGLRIPSEALALTWRDVDFAGRRFIVRSSKTAHHADEGIRVVPMFPELAPLFQAVFDDAEEGAVHVITRYRDSGQNLRTQFKRYILKAGVTPWGKLWQNLRVSRATELADLYPSHVCAAWLGHTEKIADAFYRQVTDAHFARAIGGESVAQKAAQQVAELDGKGSHTKQNPANCGELRDSANPNEDRMGVVGLEPTTLRV